jgi:hypothetical protein
MSNYVFTPSLTAALTVAKRPTEIPVSVAPVAPTATGDISDGVKMAVRAVLLGVLAAEIDNLFFRKGKRLDSRYGTIAGLVAVVGLEI